MNTSTLTVATSPEELGRIYDELLVPNFPADELDTREAFLADATVPGALVLTLRESTGRDLAVAASYYQESSGVLILSYLAVRPGIRGGGLGNRLVTGSMAQWTTRFSPLLIIGEVERPGDRPTAILQHGDPEARLRFYRRFGARRADVPYFQPALGPQGRRIPMHLMLLHIDDAVRVGEPRGGVQRIKAAPLRKFLADNIASSEGHRPDDDQARELLAALDGATIGTHAL